MLCQMPPHLSGCQQKDAPWNRVVNVVPESFIIESPIMVTLAFVFFKAAMIEASP